MCILSENGTIVPSEANGANGRFRYYPASLLREHDYLSSLYGLQGEAILKVGWCFQDSDHLGSLL